MKPTLTRLILTAVALGIVPGCGGGGGGGDGTGPETVSSVVITSPSGALLFATLGRTAQFAAEARDAGGSRIAGKTISWSSSNQSVATVGSTGLVTAVANGTTDIRASADGVQSSPLTVTVNQVTATVTVSPSTVNFGAKGSTKQLQAEARDSANNLIGGKTATFSGGDAAIASVNSTGLVTSVGNGTTQVTATIDGKVGNANVTVAILTLSVAVTPSSVSFGTIGRMQQFAAEARDSNSNAIQPKTFTWSSTNEAVVTVNSATGLATVQGSGTAQVRATTDAVIGSATVTASIVVNSVTVAALQTFTRIAQTRTVQASARDSLNNPIPNTSFTYTSSNTAVAQVNSSSGVVTSVSDGSATITVTAGGKSGNTTATVSAVANGVQITPSPVNFGAIGSSRQLSAAVVDSGGTTIPARSVAWSRAGPGTTATVGPAGLVTSTAVGTGDSAVATYTGTDGTFSGKAPITVTQVVHTVSVTPANPDTLRTTGRTIQFLATAADSNGNNIPGASFTWSSTVPAVAAVDNTGLATAGSTDGTTQIQAASGGRTGSRALVVRRYAATFSISPTSASISTVGGTQVFSGVAQDTTGVNLPITWVSRNTAILTLSASSGTSTTATARGNGTTYVVMSGGTRTDSAQVTNTNQVVVSFSAQVQPIFTGSCALLNCHSGPSPTGGLNLSAGSSYNQIVNVQAVAENFLRVKPFDAQNSYVVIKIEGRQGAGSRMPEPPNAALSSDQIQTIRDWIAAGAPNN